MIWEYFGARCAYCDRTLDPAGKEAHVDHLVSAAQGGRNHISNRALSCAQCNEKEKREMPWTEFLRAKAPTPEEFLHRFDRIQQWQAHHGDSAAQQTRDLRAAADIAAREIADLFDRKVEELRRLRPGRRGAPADRAAPRASEMNAPRACLDSEAGRDPATLPRPVVRYSSTRLTFKAALIEPLAPDEHFRVDTPEGSFQMSKDEFYEAFPKLVQTHSYRVQGVYHSKAAPRHALRFLRRDDGQGP